MQISRKDFLKDLSCAAVTAGVVSFLPARLLQAQEESRTSPRQRKIAEIEIYPFAMEARQTIRIALGTMAAENVLVRVRTNDGVAGWGEASPFSPVTGETQATDVAMGKSLAAVVRGRDPFEIARIAADMDALTPSHPSIKAAIETAVWDVCGKIAQQPVCCLLGRYRDSFETDCTVYLDTPEIMAEKAKDIVKRGFRAVKVKVGQAPDLDIRRLEAVRANVGREIKIRIDANQGWTPSDAIRALRGMEQLNVQFCEQPVLRSDLTGMRFVRSNVRIPIMADECVHSPSDAIEVVRRDAADMINIKLMKSGGILQSARIAEIASAANMECMLGCMNDTRVALTAASHVMMAQKSALYADLDAFTEHKIDPVIGGLQLKDGIITLPNTPGLGLDIDPDWLKTLRAA